MFLFDVMAIAVGFVLRLCAGTYLIGETPTAWVVLCTFFLAVFLIGKEEMESVFCFEPISYFSENLKHGK